MYCKDFLFGLLYLLYAVGVALAVAIGNGKQVGGLRQRHHVYAIGALRQLALGYEFAIHGMQLPLGSLTAILHLHRIYRWVGVHVYVFHGQLLPHGGYVDGALMEALRKGGGATHKGVGEWFANGVGHAACAGAVFVATAGRHMAVYALGGGYKG